MKKANDRRMTWCAQPAPSNRRVSFGGALRMKKLNLDFEKPKLPSCDFTESPVSPPKSNISVRRKSKRVQFEPIVEDVFEDSNVSEVSNKSVIDESAIEVITVFKFTFFIKFTFSKSHFS